MTIDLTPKIAILHLLVKRLQGYGCWIGDQPGRPFTAFSMGLGRNVQLAEIEAAALGEYLIWSNVHRAWWRPNGAGYTMHATAAGRYSHDEAIEICRTARDGFKGGDLVPTEIPVRLADIEEMGQ